VNSESAADRTPPRCRLFVALPVSAAIVLAVIFVQLRGTSLLWQEVQNTGHTLLFGAFALLILCVLRQLFASVRDRPPLGYPVAAMTSLAVGIAIELVQWVMQRDASVSDVVRDLAGIVAALGFYFPFDPRLATLWTRRARGLRVAPFVLAACLLLVGLYPLTNLALAYQARQQAFPVIMDFTANWSKPFLDFQHAKLLPATGKQIVAEQRVRLVLEPAYYPGISIVEPYPDWRGRNELVFVLWSNETEPCELVLRIHDALHNRDATDRFNRRLRVSPGENRYRIPLSDIRAAPAERDMDMSRIAGLTLFAVDIDSQLDIYPGVLRLE
jgi:hypothetical protein